MQRVDGQRQHLQRWDPAHCRPCRSLVAYLTRLRDDGLSEVRLPDVRRAIETGTLLAFARTHGLELPEGLRMPPRAPAQLHDAGALAEGVSSALAAPPAVAEAQAAREVSRTSASAPPPAEQRPAAHRDDVMAVSCASGACGVAGRTAPRSSDNAAPDDFPYDDAARIAHAAGAGVALEDVIWLPVQLGCEESARNAAHLSSCAPRPAPALGAPSLRVPQVRVARVSACAPLQVPKPHIATPPMHRRCAV